MNPKSQETVFRLEFVTGKAPKMEIPPETACPVCDKPFGEHSPEMHKACARRQRDTLE